METQPTGEINIAESLKAQKKLLDDQGDKIGFMNFIILAILVVLFIGFAGIFVACTQVLYDSWTNKAVTYENLKDQIKLQNSEIEVITEALKNNGTIKK